MNKDFKKHFSIPIIPISFKTTKDFSTLLAYKEDPKYKPVIAVKAKDSNHIYMNKKLINSRYIQLLLWDLKLMMLYKCSKIYQRTFYKKI